MILGCQDISRAVLGKSSPVCPPILMWICPFENKDKGNIRGPLNDPDEDMSPLDEGMPEEGKEMFDDTDQPFQPPANIQAGVSPSAPIFRIRQSARLSHKTERCPHLIQSRTCLPVPSSQTLPINELPALGPCPTLPCHLLLLSSSPPTQ